MIPYNIKFPTLLEEIKKDTLLKEYWFLSFSGAEIDKKDLIDLGNALRTNTVVRHIEINNCHFLDDESIIEFLKVFKTDKFSFKKRNKSVKILDFDNVEEISYITVRYLSELLKEGLGFEGLYFCDCGLDNASFALFVEGLLESKNLQHVGFSNNNLDYLSLELLIPVMEKNKNITDYYLSRNDFDTEEGIKILRKVLEVVKTNKHIHHFNIWKQVASAEFKELRDQLMDVSLDNQDECLTNKGEEND